jgi:hypothetical protein
MITRIKTSPPAGNNFNSQNQEQKDKLITDTDTHIDTGTTPKFKTESLEHLLEIKNRKEKELMKILEKIERTEKEEDQKLSDEERLRKQAQELKLEKEKLESQKWEFERKMREETNRREAEFRNREAELRELDKSININYQKTANISQPIHDDNSIKFHKQTLFNIILVLINVWSPGIGILILGIFSRSRQKFKIYMTCAFIQYLFYCIFGSHASLLTSLLTLKIAPLLGCLLDKKNYLILDEKLNFDFLKDFFTRILDIFFVKKKF